MRRPVRGRPALRLCSFFDESRFRGDGGLLRHGAPQASGELCPVPERPETESDQTATGKEQLNRCIRSESPQTACHSRDPIDARCNHVRNL
jgi:hypothetical protein